MCTIQWASSVTPCALPSARGALHAAQQVRRVGRYGASPIAHAPPSRAIAAGLEAGSAGDGAPARGDPGKSSAASLSPQPGVHHAGVQWVTCMRSPAIMCTRTNTCMLPLRAPKYTGRYLRAHFRQLVLKEERVAQSKSVSKACWVPLQRTSCGNPAARVELLAPAANPPAASNPCTCARVAHHLNGPCFKAPTTMYKMPQT